MASNSVRVESQKRMSSPENLESQRISCEKMKNTIREAEAANYPQQRNKSECLNCKKPLTITMLSDGTDPVIRKVMNPSTKEMRTTRIILLISEKVVTFHLNVLSELPILRKTKGVFVHFAGEFSRTVRL